MKQVSWHYPLFKHMAEEHGLTLVGSELDEIIHIVRSLKKSKQKKTDPRVATIIEFFYKIVEHLYYFKPVITGKDGMAIKRALKTMTEDEVMDCIETYVTKQKDQKFMTVSIALSQNNINAWRGRGENTGGVEKL